LSFVKKHGLWSDEQNEAAVRMRRIAEDKGLQTIRLSFPDQHGILRGKTLIAGEALNSLESGCSITTTLLAKDTSHRTVFPVFTEGGGFGMSEMQGGGDVLMVPDPTTFKVLPWSPTTGWLLCDLYFADGRPVPFATRGLYKSVLEKLGQRGYDFKAGLEVECHIFKVEDPRLALTDAGHPGKPGEPPAVSLLSQGYQYLTEQRYDQMEPVLDLIRRDIIALELPLRSIEVEYGPSQCEFGGHNGVVPQRGETDMQSQRLPRDVHVPAAHSECDVVGMASAPIPGVAYGWRKCLHVEREGRPVAARQRIYGRAS